MPDFNYPATDWIPRTTTTAVAPEVFTAGTNTFTFPTRELTLDADAIRVNYDFAYVSQKELEEKLENLAKKIYRTITEETKLGITEEEFLRVVLEDG